MSSIKLKYSTSPRYVSSSSSESDLILSDSEESSTDSSDDVDFYKSPDAWSLVKKKQVTVKSRSASRVIKTSSYPGLMKSNGNEMNQHKAQQAANKLHNPRKRLRFVDDNNNTARNATQIEKGDQSIVSKEENKEDVKNMNDKERNGEGKENKETKNDGDDDNDDEGSYNESIRLLIKKIEKKDEQMDSYPQMLRKTSHTMFAVVGKKIESSLTGKPTIIPQREKKIDYNEEKDVDNEPKVKSSSMSFHEDVFNHDLLQNDLSFEENDCVYCEILNNKERVARRRNDLELFRETSMAECSKILSKVENVNNIFRKYGNKAKSDEKEIIPTQDTRPQRLGDSTVFCITGEAGNMLNDPRRRRDKETLEHESPLRKRDMLVVHLKQSQIACDGSIGQSNTSMERRNISIEHGLVSPQQKTLSDSTAHVPPRETYQSKRGIEEPLRRRTSVRMSYPQYVVSKVEQCNAPITWFQKWNYAAHNDDKLQSIPVPLIHKNVAPERRFEERQKRGLVQTFFRRVRRSFSFEDISRKKRYKTEIQRNHQSSIIQHDMNANSVVKTRSRSYDNIHKYIANRKPIN
eukprot:gene4578-5180_t